MHELRNTYICDHNLRTYLVLYQLKLWYTIKTINNKNILMWSFLPSFLLSFIHPFIHSSLPSFLPPFLHSSKSTLYPILETNTEEHVY